MSAKQFTVGDAHQARILKLSLNLMIGTSAAMLAEALTLSEKAGVAWDVLLDVVANSALASPFVQYKAGQLRNRDFSPMFMAQQMAKDFHLLAEAGHDLDVPMPVADQVARYWDAMMQRGLGEEDFIACLKIVEQDADLA
jgi:3-hydroxyisobutyrate dehydrogenase